MQRVAAELGFTKMALYRYVPGRAELIALMVNSAAADPPILSGGPADWRAQLGQWARRLLALLQRHPWLLDATVGPRITGPNELSWMEHSVAALDGTGLDGSERMDAVVVTTGHVRTIAQQSRTSTGTPEHDPEEGLGAVIAELMRNHGDRFPAVSAALASANRHPSRDTTLKFALDGIFDGLGALIAIRYGAG